MIKLLAIFFNHFITYILPLHNDRYTTCNATYLEAILKLPQSFRSLSWQKIWSYVLLNVENRSGKEKMLIQSKDIKKVNIPTCVSGVWVNWICEPMMRSSFWIGCEKHTFSRLLSSSERVSGPGLEVLQGTGCDKVTPGNSISLWFVNTFLYNGSSGTSVASCSVENY